MSFIKRNKSLNYTATTSVDACLQFVQVQAAVPGKHRAAGCLNDMVDAMFGVGCSITLFEETRKLFQQLADQGGGIVEDLPDGQPAGCGEEGTLVEDTPELQDWVGHIRK